MTRIKNLATRVLIGLILTSGAHAASEGAYALSVSGGIAAPGRTLSLVENPAGLIYNRQFHLVAQGATNNSSADPLGLAGGLFIGNGVVGAAANYVSANGASLARFGGSAYLSPLKIALGLSSGTDIDSTGGPVIGASTSTDIGILYDPFGKTRVGFTAFGLDGGVDHYGLGVAHNLSADFFVVADAVSNADLDQIRVKPGLGVTQNAFQVTVGYGFDARSEGGTNRRMADGFAAGLGLRLTQNAHLQFYYNQIAKYAAALSFRL